MSEENLKRKNDQLFTDDEECQDELTNNKVPKIAEISDAMTEQYSKIGNDYVKLSNFIASNTIYQIDDNTAMELLNQLPRETFTFVFNSPFNGQMVWQFASIFKTRSAFYPVPQDNFNNYSINNFSNWCFHNGTTCGCMHRGCNVLYNCFLRAHLENRFFLALYISLTRSIPKTTASSLLVNNQVNRNCSVFFNGNALYSIVDYYGLVYYAFDKESFPSSDPSANCGIKVYQALFQKGANRYELFNRRSTTYSIAIDHPRYSENAFIYNLKANGDVVIDSQFALTEELRLSRAIMHRKFNYETRLNTLDYRFGRFTLVKFKDIIHMNRQETVSVCTRLIILLGGMPILENYRSQKEKNEFSRDFYFLYRNNFPAERLMRMYKNVFFPLSYTEVEFDFDVEPKFREPIEPINMVVSTQKQQDGYPKSTKLLPLITSKDLYEYKAHRLEEDNYLLLKPTAYKLNKFATLLCELIKHKAQIYDMVARPITDYEFNILYPNCLNQRVYGPDWYSHMTAGPCVIIKCDKGSFEQLRSCAWAMREISGLPWTRNVVHSACDKAERDLMISLFEADFLNISEDDLKFKIFAC